MVLGKNWRILSIHIQNTGCFHSGLPWIAICVMVKDGIHMTSQYLGIMPSSTGNDVGQKISHNCYSRILMVRLTSIMRWYTKDSARRGFAGNYKEIDREENPFMS